MNVSEFIFTLSCRAVFCFGGVILRALYNVRMAADSSGPNASKFKSSDSPNNCKRVNRF